MALRLRRKTRLRHSVSASRWPHLQSALLLAVNAACWPPGKAKTCAARGVAGLAMAALRAAGPAAGGVHLPRAAPPLTELLNAHTATCGGGGASAWHGWRCLPRVSRSRETRLRRGIACASSRHGVGSARSRGTLMNLLHRQPGSRCRAHARCRSSRPRFAAPSRTQHGKQPSTQRRPRRSIRPEPTSIRGRRRRRTAIIGDPGHAIQTKLPADSG